MRLLHTTLLLVAALPAAAGDDAVARCRDAHPADPAAHIRCLEEALQGPAVPATVTPPAAVTAPTAATALGVEQAEARKRAADPVAAAAATATVRIVDVRYDAADLGTFRMADGQVWRETVATPARLHLKPGREYDAEIERGVVGGYRMRVDGVRWLHKVERLE
jgi:hypothetical protein